MYFNGLLSHRRHDSRSIVLTYGVALAAVLLATLLRELLDPILHTQVAYGLYYVAVAVAAWYGGLGPALLAMLLSAFAARFFFVDPRFTLTLRSPGDLFAWLLFLGIALVTSLL